VAETYSFSAAPIYFVFRIWWTIYIFVKMNEGTFGILFKYVRKFLSGFLLNQILTYQGWFLVASPWLIFHLWKWHPSPSTILYQTFHLVRFTSSGIRASALDTGSVVVFIDCQFRLFSLIVQVRFVVPTMFVFRWLFKFVLSLLLCSYFVCLLFFSFLFCFAFCHCFCFRIVFCLCLLYCILSSIILFIVFILYYVFCS